MQSFLSIAFCLLFVLAIIVITLAAHALFDKWWIKRHQSSSNEFTGIIFASISLIYSLIIAFVIVASWEDYEELNQTIEQETDKLNDIVTQAAVLPSNLELVVDTTIAKYCNQVIHDWSTPGADSYHQSEAIPRLRVSLFRTLPQNQFQENLLENLDNALKSISDLRRERISHVRSHIPTLVWLILLIGSVLIIVFSFFVNTESTILKRIGISFLVALIGMSLFLVYSLDHPYGNNIHINNTPYQKVLLRISNKV